jgi:pimeloyl-ACP methyl ester carboxylesterase
MNHRKQHWYQAVAALLLCFARGFAYAGCSNAPDFESRVEGGPECLVIKTFRSTVAEQKPVLLVFLHGSVSRGGPADYFFRHAERWANDMTGVIAVALLRPGYADRNGNESSGNYLQRRDIGWSKNVDSVANALEKLKTHHDAGKLVVVGHSAGAAYAGAMLGKFPGLIDSAILVATTCDADLFYRAHNWGGAPANESTLKYADKVPKNTQVIFLTGSNDAFTPISLARSCHEALLTNGVRSSLYEVAGAEHDNKLFASPEFVSAMKSVLTVRSGGDTGERAAR